MSLFPSTSPIYHCEAPGCERGGLRLCLVVGADGARSYHWFCELHRSEGGYYEIPDGISTIHACWDCNCTLGTSENCENCANARWLFERNRERQAEAANN